MDALALPVFRENLVAMPICRPTHDRRLWIWIYPWTSMDISMDIHGKSVDMDMDMDGKFHIHGKPGYIPLPPKIWQSKFYASRQCFSTFLLQRNP